jgi:hypothetical protein
MVDVLPTSDDLNEIIRWHDMLFNERTGMKPTKQSIKTLRRIQSMLDMEEDYIEILKKGG